MKKYVLFFLASVLTSFSFAEAPTIALESPNLNSNDTASIVRGAKFFATHCMACHTMIYLKYNPLASEAGVTYDKMPVSVTQWPNNVKPPDLSLVADLHGIDWLYTYLHSFYQDRSRPSGFNNLVLPNTAMPNILAPYQGLQILATDIQLIQKNQGPFEWYDVLTLQQQGSMTPAQFDATIADVVNFLSYASHPYQAKQRQIGYWVLGFLSILFVLMYLLKKSYWQDLKKGRKKLE